MPPTKSGIIQGSWWLINREEGLILMSLGRRHWWGTFDLRPVIQSLGSCIETLDVHLCLKGQSMKRHQGQHI